MARLIDAEALPVQKLYSIDETGEQMVVYAVDVLDIGNAPAIDHRTRAKWIDFRAKDGKAGIFCSHCFTSDRVHREMKFCPNCGAIMEEEKKE